MVVVVAVLTGLCCLLAGSLTTDLGTPVHWEDPGSSRQGTLISLSLSVVAESLNPSQVARQSADTEIMVVITSYYTRYLLPPSHCQPRIYTIKSITGSHLSWAGDNTSLLALLWRPGEGNLTQLKSNRSGGVKTLLLSDQVFYCICCWDGKVLRLFKSSLSSSSSTHQQNL